MLLRVGALLLPAAAFRGELAPLHLAPRLARCVAPVADEAGPEPSLPADPAMPFMQVGTSGLTDAQTAPPTHPTHRRAVQAEVPRAQQPTYELRELRGEPFMGRAEKNGFERRVLSVWAPATLLVSLPIALNTYSDLEHRG